MKKIIILTICLTSSTLFSQNIQFDWVTQIGGTSTEVGMDLFTDGSGNVYATGSFSGTVDFDPGPNTENLTSFGSEDAYIQKLDIDGNLIWSHQIGGDQNDFGHSITVDPSGNVLITGYFQGTVDFDPNTGTSNLSSSGDWDIFILKLDANGNFLWAKSFGASNIDYGYYVTTDLNGNAIITGGFIGVVDFDPGPNTNYMSSLGGFDIFVLKLDPNGDFLWATQSGGIASDLGQAVETDGNGNIFVTGYFQNIVDFDPSSGILNFSSNGDWDIFLQKLDANGNLIWAKQMGGSGKDRGYTMIPDVNGNVYTTGYFSGSVDFDPGSGTNTLISSGLLDAYIQKLDSNGDLLWVKKIGGSSNDVGQAMAIDGSGNVYTAGIFDGTADFDPGTGTNMMSSNGSWDIYIHKLSPNGDLLWVEQIGGSAKDNVRALKIDDNRNLYLTGEFAGTTDFDFGGGNAFLTNLGNDDAFVLKLKQNRLGEKELSLSDVKLYPNPNKGVFTLDLGNTTSTEITIHNINGKVLHQFKTTQIQSFNLDLKPGFYFLRVSNKSEVKEIKFIINQ